MITQEIKRNNGCGGRSAGEVGHGAVLVVLHLAILGEPDYEDDGADHGNEAEKYPPARFVDVVEAAHRQAETGQQKGEAEKAVGGLRGGRAEAKQKLEQAQGASQYEGKKHPPPIFRT